MFPSFATSTIVTLPAAMSASSVTAKKPPPTLAENVKYFLTIIALNKSRVYAFG